MSLLAVINPDDEVLIYEPAWVSYPEQVRLCHGIPVMIPHDKDVFEFEGYITNRTKVIIINNPNNPTGKIYSVEELTYLTRLAERYGLFILSDEAYSDFLLDDDSFVSLGNIDKEKKYSIICNSMSKNYGMSGWRIGYVVSNELLIDQILKINQHLITCPATILEYYMAQHFEDVLSVTKKQIKCVVQKRMEVMQYMDKIGLEYMQGSATFYIFASIKNSKLSSEVFCDTLLNEKKISVVPGIGYGRSCDKFIRVSIGTEPLDRVFYALDEIKKLINA
jgi:aspartate aminotransferase/aminotransferase